MDPPPPPQVTSTGISTSVTASRILRRRFRGTKKKAGSRVHAVSQLASANLDRTDLAFAVDRAVVLMVRLLVAAEDVI